MAVQLFKKMAFSSVYQKYMVPVSNEVINILLSYVKAKTNEQPLEMLVDVGCGTGRYTLPLAPHFKKVLGIDMSESQINVAKQNTLANNVSYMVASAEKIPVKNDSVDLVHAGLAAHWFTIDKFLNESV
ncbi:putative methyltransferase DDB_G0268948 [Bufo bufo]|nr:putative methyltransferase DDB_G0268948 [Bufo bufo]